MNEMSQNSNQSQPNAAPIDLRAAQPGNRSGRGERAQADPFGGAILVILGIYFWGHSLGWFYLNNWWALFILLPAAGALSNAFQLSEDAGGRFTRAARASLLLGILLVCAAAVFLFGFNWALFGPVLIILAGLGILVGFVLVD